MTRYALEVVARRKVANAKAAAMNLVDALTEAEEAIHAAVVASMEELPVGPTTNEPRGMTGPDHATLKAEEEGGEDG